MEEKGLRVLEANTTFFSKISTSITKLLIPTKVGINGMLITMKRNNVVKTYEAYTNLKEVEESEKKDSIKNKYEDAYALYLEAVDKYIMDSVYTKVKNDNASEFEKNALSKYYEVTHLKESEYLEYKYRKQKYLLELDYETIKDSKKAKDKYMAFYSDKMDSLYKAILKNYSIQLSDQIHSNTQYKNKIYSKIFSTLEDYITSILPIKLHISENNSYQSILREYEDYSRFSVGKLDEKDNIERNMILIGISRQLFTHSLPLIAAEQCYIYLLKQTRELILNSKNKLKQDEAYKLLITLIEDYNIKLLSTKIYWDKPGEKEEYKKFWNMYKEAKDEKEKEILFLRYEIQKLRKGRKDHSKIIKYYKEKLILYGVMRNLKNYARTIEGKYTKLNGKS